MAKNHRQVDLKGRSRDGSAGRNARKGRAAAEISSFAAGVDVDCGSLADGQHSYETFGGKLRPVPAFGRDRPWASSSLATHIAVRKGLTAPASLPWTEAWGTQWGQTDGRGFHLPSHALGRVPPRSGNLRVPLPLTVLAFEPRDPWAIEPHGL